MMHSAMSPHSANHTTTVSEASLLPETQQLLEAIRGAKVAQGLNMLSVPDPGRTAFYRAHPQRNLPFLWFSIADADSNLLAFTGKTAPGFEVLQVRCGGLQNHWRSDLMRATKEETPLISRLYGLSDTRELIVDHLAMPVIRRHQVQEICGWFTFSQSLNSCEGWASLNGLSMFQKLERSKPAELPRALSHPDRRSALAQRLLIGLKTAWRPFGSHQDTGQSLVERL